MLDPLSSIFNSSFARSQLQQQLLRLLESGRDLKRAKHFAPGLLMIARRLERARKIVVGFGQVRRRKRDLRFELANRFGEIDKLKINGARQLVQAGVERLNVETLLERVD